MDNTCILKYKEGIAQALINYKDKMIEIELFRSFNMYRDIIMLKLGHDEIKRILNGLSVDGNEGEKYESSLEKMRKIEKNYLIISLESVYKLYFQNFEEFLSDILYTTYNFYPKYLNKNESKSEISINRIFDEHVSIDEIRDYIISNKVKKIIQSNNILNIIKNIENNFSIRFEIEPENLNTLFVTSLNRNLLTHNRGIINEIYLELLRSRGLSIENFQKGDSITETIKNTINGDSDNQINIADKIYKKFDNDSNRLYGHHSSLK